MVDASYNKPGNLRRGLKWRDIMVKVSGPVVSSLNRVFMGDWYIETGELLEDSPPSSSRPREAQRFARLSGASERPGLW